MIDQTALRFAVFAAALFLISAPAARADVALDGARRGELIRLVRNDCGSCHGLTLAGGLGPALLPGALQDKPVENLKSVILYGRPGTAMPPWSRFMSPPEAEWIVNELINGFPDEH
ncbi:MAG: c-type cytochrome [Betaproteobacteria bacterium]